MNDTSTGAQAPIQQLAAELGFELPVQYNASRLLWDNLPGNADRPAIITDTARIDYAGLADMAATAGHALRDAGARPGSRVLIFMDDEPWHPATIMGALRAGCVPMMINTLSTDDLLGYYLDDSEAHVAVCSTHWRERVEALQPAHASLLAVLDSHALEQRYRQALSSTAGTVPTLPEHPTQRDDMAFWMYSSGSTGRPKGIVHRHEDMAYTARTYARETLAIDAEDICFSVPKIYFAYGFGNSVTFPMSVGAAAVLLEGRPTPERVYAQIREHRPTLLFGLPTLYTALIHDDSASNADLSSVRLCLSAAEVLSDDIASAWTSRFGHRIVEGLGSTEMLHIYLSNSIDEQRAGSAGRVVPGYAIELLDDNGNPVADGEEGQMRVCGLSGAHYYWNRPEKTAETMRDGWLLTGDRFLRDADGYYYFRGRVDDLVKVSGQWVYPLEIELTLAKHPMIRECCVQAIALPDQRMTLIAWVVLHGDAALDDSMTRDLQGYTRSQLLPHKYPRILRKCHALPKTGTDKIDRQALLNDYHAEADR